MSYLKPEVKTELSISLQGFSIYLVSEEVYNQ